MLQTRGVCKFSVRWTARIYKHRCCSSSFPQKKIEMPKFMNGETGCVEKWLKKEGEGFKADESICEVTIDGVTLGIDQKEAGVVAEILIPESEEVPVGKYLAIVVDDTEAYDAFVTKYKKLDMDNDVSKNETNDSSGTDHSGTENRPSNITLIKTVKKLIKADDINENDDFAHDLLSLCREGNSKLEEAFDASFDGEEFNEETFDSAFFIQNARVIVFQHIVHEAK